MPQMQLDALRVRSGRRIGLGSDALRLVIRLSFGPIAYQAAPVTRLSQALMAVAWFVATVGVIVYGRWSRAFNLGFPAAIGLAVAAAC